MTPGMLRLGLYYVLEDAVSLSLCEIVRATENQPAFHRQPSIAVSSVRSVINRDSGRVPIVTTLQNPNIQQ